MCCFEDFKRQFILFRFQSEMLSGFPALGEGGEEEEEIDTFKLVQDMNRKKKKSGGFQVCLLVINRGAVQKKI